MKIATQKIKMRATAFLLAAGVLLSLAACQSQESVEAAAKVNVITVQVQTPKQGDISVSSQFIGTIEPDEQVSVFPKVAGTVLSTYFNVGEKVKKGDLLFEIDPTDIQLQYNVTQAQVDAARVAADQSLGSGYDAGIIGAKAQLDAAQQQLNATRSNLKNYNNNYDDLLISAEKQEDNLLAEMKSLQTKLEEATKNHDDITELAKKLAEVEVAHSVARNAVNELDNDDDPTLRSLRTAFKNSQIAYDAARAAYELVSGESKEDATKTVEANLRAVEAGLQAQARQLEYTKIYAPIDGVVEQKNVSAQSIASQQSPAYTVSNKENILAIFFVSADAATQMQEGDAIIVESGKQEITGTIVEIGNTADAATGLFKIKASLQTESHSLLTGVSVKITADTQKSQDTLMIAESSIYYENGRSFVYLAQGEQAVKVEVTLGISNGEWTQVTSDLPADAQIISSWSAALKDGAMIKLSEQDASSSQADANQPQQGE